MSLDQDDSNAGDADIADFNTTGRVAKCIKLRFVVSRRTQCLCVVPVMPSASKIAAINIHHCQASKAMSEWHDNVVALLDKLHYKACSQLGAVGTHAI